MCPKTDMNVGKEPSQYDMEGEENVKFCAFTYT